MSSNGTESQPIGPAPGEIVELADYMTESEIQDKLKSEGGVIPVREITDRLDGVTLIEAVRVYLQLPTKTLNCAATYYHQFRINQSKRDWHFQDAALACLLVACKAEDTMKKPREILCAAYNLKGVGEEKTADDKSFDKLAQTMTGLERRVLESITFNFNTRDPQTPCAKLMKRIFTLEELTAISPTVWSICIDLNKTLVLLKVPAWSIALAVVEIAAHLTDVGSEAVKKQTQSQWWSDRPVVVSAMLDILELYAQHPKHTIVGKETDPAKLIDFKIVVNQEQDTFFHVQTSPYKPKTTSYAHASSEISASTTRFIFDHEAARHEREVLCRHFEDQYEEHEVEVEEPEPGSKRERSIESRSSHSVHRGSGGRGHNVGSGPSLVGRGRGGASWGRGNESRRSQRRGGFH